VEFSGFDYIALGHLHDATGINATGINKIGETYLAYPVCLEGRNFDETGHKGAMFGEIDKGVCDLKAIRCSKKRYEIVEVDISQYVTESQILDGIKVEINSFREDTAVRINLTGTVRPNFAFNPMELEKKITGVHFVQIQDKTRPYLDIESLRRDKTVKGIFYKRLEDKLNSTNEKEREEAIATLRYGLNSFASLDIIDF
jgi:DNA repair exonuclease SbcCD nuclease subunit